MKIPRALLLALAMAASALSQERPTLLVFPPRNSAAEPAPAWVAEAVALSIAAQVRGPSVRTIDRESRLRFVEEADLPPRSPLSRASMISVAQAAGAERIVIGQISGPANRMRISIRLLDVAKLRLSGEITVSGPEALLPQMENDLAWGVLGALQPDKSSSRDGFRKRARTVPNPAYSAWIRSMAVDDPEERLRLLEQAVTLHADFAEAHFDIGSIFYAEAEFGRAAEHLDRAASSPDFGLRGRFLLATSLLHEGSLDRAIQLLGSVVSFARFPPAFNNLAVAHLRKGDALMAAQNLVDARNLDRSNPVILHNLALVRYLQGNAHVARNLIDELGRQSALTPQMSYLLAQARSASGDTAGAAAALEGVARSGGDPAKLGAEDPRTWARLLTDWQGVR